MFSNASFTSYGLTPLLPPSVVAEGVTAVNNALHIRHRLTSLMRSYHRCQPAMEQVDTKLNQTLEMLGLSTLTSASWKEIIQGSYVGAVLSDPRAALEEPFSFSSIRHKSATSIHSMSFHSFQPPRRKFSTFNHQRHILHSPSSLSRGWRTIPGYYRSITEHKLRMLEDRANSETDDATIQAKYLKEVVSQDPAYVMRRYESGKYAIDEEVRSIYWQAVILLQGRQKELRDMDTVQESELGSKENPMTVSVIPKKHGVMSEMWSLFRTLGVILVLLGLFSSSMVAKIRSGASQMVGDFQPNVGEKTYTFEDVQGVDEAKDELREVVEFLKNPERFQKLGARLPRGILLVGPPGTGKTLLAKAISGEAEVPFYFCSGSEFDEMFVGVGASRMRQLFEKARKNKPCVLFIDELDAVGGARIASSLHPYSRMTLNQLLVEMDGFKELDGIIIIGATNFPESLDKALIRAGRFDTRINTTLPDVRARHKILQVHAAKVKLHQEMDLETVARTTTGFSGADLANLVNQAALRGSADGKDAVTMKDFDWARDKIIMGAERKNAVIAEENRRLVAYHEAGHAVVALWTPGAMKVYKATIVPRGSALGMVAQLPEKDELHWSRKQLLARMDVAMGGRVAEEMVFGAENVTSGASSDVEVASRLARTMITRYAMSDVVGPVAPMEDEKTSPEMSNLIEQEVKRFTKEAYERAKHVLQTHTVEHKRLAEALLKYETLDLEEIKLVVQGKPLDRSL